MVARVKKNATMPRQKVSKKRIYLDWVSDGKNGAGDLITMNQIELRSGYDSISQQELENSDGELSASSQKDIFHNHKPLKPIDLGDGTARALGEAINYIALTVRTEEIKGRFYMEEYGPVIDPTICIQFISNDPSTKLLWGMDATGFGCKAITAWDRGYVGSTKCIVGIVDTGIDYTHPDIYLNIWINQGEIKGLSFFKNLVDTDKDGLITFRDLNDQINWSLGANKLSDWNRNGYIDAGDLLDNRSGWEDTIDNDNNGYLDDLIGWDFANRDNDPYDDNGHGTHVAGTIGAVGGNGIGVAGVNWKVQMAGLKFLDASGSGLTSNAALAVDYFTTSKRLSGQRGESGLFVGTNNSWGGGGYSQALNSAISKANDADLLFVAAAGNGGMDGIGDNNDIIANYPSNYSGNNIVAVAAITSSGTLARYSNYGIVNVDLGAPGSNVLSTVPNGYTTYSGTSMATPHVTGTAALLKSINPNASAIQIKQAIIDTATPIGSLLGKVSTGSILDTNAAASKLAVTSQQTNVVIWGTIFNDLVQGGGGNDLLSGVPQTGNTGSALGRGQIDTLTGGAGVDGFILGDSRGTFYNDGSTRSQGINDYALITDFKRGEDFLQLCKGSQYLYRYNNAATEVYLGNGDQILNARDELIAKLQGANITTGTGIFQVQSNDSWARFV